ncbi:hypothetical protein BC477_15440 [Clavibacter michiganensis subsp. michiganensis]|uniref:Energy-coupling factor transporter transmembrane protein EcfT n=1 Tax=Clavibacter michiganensis subsp. michiganensis TaxID=33013 RepID=A0A251XF55_CLAMM|nr:hypothetical protein BC477_15440 [Clavibacter michiganensis subsp. michiganensis]OUE01199.1 hypothetical protein CMMCAS07_12900 [Clavibacter michiganensis subsp. michiganensis]
MSAAPSVVVPTARATGLAAVNPVARLAAALVLTLVLVLSLDVVSAGAALLLELLLLPFAGLRPRAFLVRGIPIWIAAPGAGLTILLYGRTSGEVYAQFLLVVVSEGSVLLAVATTLRVLAIGVASLVLFSDVDPTDLADGLAQVARLPSRFVLGRSRASGSSASSSTTGARSSSPAARGASPTAVASAGSPGRPSRSSCSPSAAAASSPPRWRPAGSAAPSRARGPGPASSVGARRSSSSSRCWSPPAR